MFRVGIGYDIHRLVPGRLLVLGGVTIPHPLGLDGHSDADVLCHAIADALLGAVALPDIGHHFPVDDPRCRGMSSLMILEKVAVLLGEQNALIQNVDATLIAERPKIAPHLAEMKTRIGAALGIHENRVGIKATTNELLGSIGRGEGIAALATASVIVSD